MSLPLCQNSEPLFTDSSCNLFYPGTMNCFPFIAVLSCPLLLTLYFYRRYSLWFKHSMLSPPRLSLDMDSSVTCLLSEKSVYSHSRTHHMTIDVPAAFGSITARVVVSLATLPQRLSVKEDGYLWSVLSERNFSWAFHAAFYGLEMKLC